MSDSLHATPLPEDPRAAASIAAFATPSDGLPPADVPASVDALVLELAAERARREAAEAALARARLVADVMSEIVGTVEHEGRIARLARAVIPALGDWCAVDLLLPDGSFRRVAVEHRDGDSAKVALAHEIERRYPEDPASPTGRTAAVARRAAIWVPEITEAMIDAGARDDEHARMVRTLGLCSFVIAPLVTGPRVLGTLTLVTAESGRRYDAVDVSLVEDLARRTARLIEVGELHETLREHERALTEQAVELELQATQLEETMAEFEMANETLREYTVELEAANRAKADFLAMMSHELRTPLNAIAGYVDLLELGIRGPLTAAQREDVGRIRRAQLQLLSIISDILNFARLEQGKLEFHVAPVAVASAIEDLTAIMTPQVAARGLSWRAAPVDASLVVAADAERLAQVLRNLAQNAAKFTASGGITVTVEPRPTTVAIHVRDTGRGIPAERLAAIWEPFVQIDRQNTPESDQGLGLGLPISRELARAMGGDLTAASVAGAGSTFTLELPRA